MSERTRESSRMLRDIRATPCRRGTAVCNVCGRRTPRSPNRAPPNLSPRHRRARGEVHASPSPGAVQATAMARLPPSGVGPQASSALAGRGRPHRSGRPADDARSRPAYAVARARRRASSVAQLNHNPTPRHTSPAASFRTTGSTVPRPNFGSLLNTVGGEVAESGPSRVQAAATGQTGGVSAVLRYDAGAPAGD